MASRGRLEAILEAKSAILEAKRENFIFYVDFWEGSVEWRDVFGYAKSTASTALMKHSTRLSILSGCGGFFALRACHRPLDREVFEKFSQNLCPHLE